ncbi:MAG: regulatory signaling modulator protein AmpE [Pseudomonadales bacterium]
MEFIVVLFSALVIRFPHALDTVQRDDWFETWQEALRDLPLPLWLKLALMVLVPVLLMVCLLQVFHGALFGLVQFALVLLLLTYSLGRRGYEDTLVQFTSAFSKNDSVLAMQSLRNDGLAEDDDDLVSIQYESEYELAYYEFERWFAVVFWFVVAGAAGAFAYRVLVLAAERHKVCVNWLGFAEWIPARLTGLSVGLVGDFDATLAQWEETLDHGFDTRACLHSFVGSSIPPDLSLTEANQRLHSLRRIFQRAMILWVVFAALVVLIF